MLHKLKIFDHFADAILRGDKTFEVRKNDRGFQVGDEVVFENRNKEYAEINKMKFEITYVLSGWGIEPGYVVFGIEQVVDQ